VGASQSLMEPVAELEERVEGRRLTGPEEGCGLREVAAVGDEIPVAGEAAQAFESLEVEGLRLEEIVGWEGVVDHGPFLVVARDGRSAEAFEQADLDLVRLQGEEAVEAAGEGLERFAGESRDEVGVDVDAGVVVEEAEVLLEARDVLSAADALAHLGVEGLDADLELKAAGWESWEEGPDFVREAVGDHLEVEEQIVLPVVEEELEDGGAGVATEVERSVDELEAAQSAVKEAAPVLEERFEGEGADGHVEGREAELAGERAAAGRLDVDRAVFEVVIGVFRVGGQESGGIGEWGMEDVWDVVVAGQEVAADVGEGEVGLACDDVVG